MSAPLLTETAAACVRCGRTEHDHLLQDRDEADDIRRRIWRALGYPCAQFTDELAAVFAGNQAATSRWARQPGQRAPQSATASMHAAQPGAGRAAYLQARQALARRKEAS